MAKLCLLGAKKITLLAKTKAFLSLDTRWRIVFEVNLKKETSTGTAQDVEKKIDKAMVKRGVGLLIKKSFSYVLA